MNCMERRRRVGKTGFGHDHSHGRERDGAKAVATEVERGRARRREGEKAPRKGEVVKSHLLLRPRVERQRWEATLEPRRWTERTVNMTEGTGVMVN